jgi:hypothetical protein
VPRRGAFIALLFATRGDAGRYHDTMRTRRSRSAFVSPYLLASVGALTACGAAPPPPSEPVAVIGPVQESKPAVQEAGPVQEPPALILAARWKGPVRDAERTLEALGMPMPLADMFIVATDPDAKNLDFEGSVDAAMSLDPASTDTEPKVYWAISFPLHSFSAQVDFEEKEGKHVFAVRPGVVRAEKGNVADCEIARAPGAPDDGPARMVCGQGARDLDALGDWLERGLGATPPRNDDLVVSVRARPLQDRYLTPLRAQAATLGDQARAALSAQNVTDPDLVAAPGTVLDDGIQFLQDIDGMVLRVSLGSAPPGLTVGGALRFGGNRAWLTRVLVDANDKAGPPPPMFWQVPRDAYSASWGRRGDPRLFDPVTRTLHKALTLALERAPMLPPADKDAIEAFVAATPGASSTWVSSQGVLHGGKKRPHPAKPTPAESLAELKDMVAGALGWHVLGFEGSASEYVTWLKLGVDLYGRAVRLGKSFLPAKPSEEQRRYLSYVPRITTVTALPGWPRGTVAFDVQLGYDSELAAVFLPKPAEAEVAGEAGRGPKAPPAKGSLTLRLAVVPDGDHTWIGLSSDLDELKKRMTAALSGAPREGTLAARDGLAPLRDPGQTWGGFFSVGSIVDRAFEELEHKRPADAADVRAMLAALPNRGQTPILFVGSGATGATPTTGGELRFQTGSLADATGLLRFLMSVPGRALLKKLDAP